MSADPMFAACDDVFTVDYDRRPFCLVRATGSREAVDLAEKLLAVARRADAKHGIAAVLPPARPLAKGLLKLRARRPTDSERIQFAMKLHRNGTISPYLAAVMIG